MQDHERLAHKVGRMRPSLTLALKAITETRRAQGLPVYDFGLGETKGPLEPRIREAGARAFMDADTMYTDPAGLPALREKVLEWLNLEREYLPDDVVVSAGAKQSLFNVFLALCNPGDTVLFEAAPWVSYDPLAIAATATSVLVLPQTDPHLKVSAGDLERNLRLRPHARLFLLNNPCNPTAQLYEQHEVDALLEVCVRHRVYFVLDRLYWKILFDGRRYPEPRLDARTKPWVIQVDGLSKNWRSTGGIRIGWCVAPRDVAKAMANLQSHYTSGASVPAQRAALAAITKPYQDEMIADLQKKRDLLKSLEAELPHVTAWPTPATFYSFWDVRRTFGLRTPDGQTLKSSDELSAYLCERAGVVTASGAGFFQDGFLRLSFATPDEQIREGMAAAKIALAALAP